MGRVWLKFKSTRINIKQHEATQEIVAAWYKSTKPHFVGPVILSHLRPTLCEKTQSDLVLSRNGKGNIQLGMSENGVYLPNVYLISKTEQDDSAMDIWMDFRML